MLGRRSEVEKYSKDPTFLGVRQNSDTINGATRGQNIFLHEISTTFQRKILLHT